MENQSVQQQSVSQPVTSQQSVTSQQPVTSPQPDANQVNILEVDVTDENVALNLLVNFVNIAQKRGIYSLPEASKIWECIRRFQKPQ